MPQSVTASTARSDAPESPPAAVEQPAAAPAARRLLVFGEDTRAFLAIVRSLGRRGHEVHAVARDPSSPALASRYLKAVHRLTPHSSAPQLWLAGLRRLIADQGFDLLIPCSDNNLLLLHAHRDDIEGARLALPNVEAMSVFFDKSETRRLAARLGIPIAKGRELWGMESAEELEAELGLPLMLKPSTTYSLGQSSAKSSVAKIRSRAELEEALADAERYGLAEAFFPGVGVGLSILADHGTVLQAFQHRRLQEASMSGGSSSRISEPVEPSLLAAVETLTRATALHGPAMFEFRRDRRTGQWVLLEVNPRLWGSLPLALAAGADFPAALCELYLGGSVPAAGDYRVGVVRRGLFAEYHRIVAEAELSGKPPWRFLLLAYGLARLTLTLAVPARFDAHAPDDPAPWRAERRGLLLWVFGALAKRLPLAPARFRNPAEEAGA
jgi:predicted ATP-grasp superfamily ATP-dependent carboligase